MSEAVMRVRPIDGSNIAQDGRYGPESEPSRMGPLAQGACHVTSGVLSIGEDGCTIGSNVYNGALEARPLGRRAMATTSGAVVGGFGSMVSLFAGFLPLETGFRLYQRSKKSDECPEDVWGEARGASKMFTGGLVIGRSLFDLISRTFFVVRSAGTPMSAECLAAGVSIRLLSTVLQVVIFLSMGFFSAMSLYEGHIVRQRIRKIREESEGNTSAALVALQKCVQDEPLFAKQLERTTKASVLDEVLKGRLNAKSQESVAKRQDLPPQQDDAAAVIEHVMLKLNRRSRVNKVLIGLSLFSLGVAVFSMVAGGSVSLIIASALSIVETLMWFGVDVPSFVSALKRGKSGRFDGAVLMLTTALLVSLVIISSLVSTGLVGLIVMSSLAAICMAVQLRALQVARRNALQPMGVS